MRCGAALLGGAVVCIRVVTCRKKWACRVVAAGLMNAQVVYGKFWSRVQRCMLTQIELSDNLTAVPSKAAGDIASRLVRIRGGLLPACHCAKLTALAIRPRRARWAAANHSPQVPPARASHLLPIRVSSYR